MRGRKRKGRERTAGLLIALFIAVFVVIAFSLAVRWTGFGQRSAPEAITLQIEVLNGTGEPGIARTTTLELRKMGIDVLIEQNASRFDFTETLLIDRKGNSAVLERLAKRIGCRRVLKQIQDRPEVDATLVLGWDRERLKLGD